MPGLDDRDFKAELYERHRHFHAEEAPSDHGSALCIASRAPDGVCVAFIMQGKHPRERRTWNLQGPRNAAGRDQELAIANLSGRSGYDLPGRIDGKNAAVKPKVNGMIAIKAFRMDEELVLMLVAEQKPLGQGRMMIGRQRLGR